MKIYIYIISALISINLNAQIQPDLWFMNFNEGTNSTGVIVKSNPDSCGFSVVYNFSTAYPSSGTDGAFCEAADGNLYGIIPRGKNEGGMISKFNPSTYEYSIVYFFDGCDFGRVGYPNSELISGSDYKLYGVTGGGGLNNAGIIFSFDIITNNFTKLHDFDTIDGRFPVGKLLLTQDNKLYGMTSRGGVFNLGVIFSYDINTNNYSKILDFNSDNGASPLKNSLTQASNGNLYGMTFQGGINNLGVIFSINPNTDSYTKHFDFSFSNAKYPRANLIEANDGNLYGMAQGGANNSGIIFQFNPITNVYTLKYSLPATFNNPQNSLIQASDGKLYGTGMLNLFSFDYNTSIYTNQIDFTLPNGSILANEAGYYPNTLIQASNGKMYGNTTQGGSSTLGTFFSFDIGNNSLNKIFDYSSGNNGFLPNQRLIEASNGKLYGTCFSGGQFALGTIFCIDPTTYNLETVLNFNDTLGAQPQGSLINGNDGKLYGMTTYGGGGGGNSAGVIFSLDPISNAYNILFNFNNLPYLAGNPQGSLIQASNGLLYGMAQWNSAGNDFGNIFSLDPITNQYTELFVFDVISGAYPYGSLMEASNGLLYGTTSMGGESGIYCFGTLFSFNTQNNSFTKLVDFESAFGLICAPEGNFGPRSRGTLVQINNGKIYGTVGNGYASGKIFSYDIQTNQISTLFNIEADDGLAIYSANRSDWIDYSLTIGNDGNLYGQTFALGGGVCNNSCIYRFNTLTNEFRKIYEYGVGNIHLTGTEAIASCQAYTWNGNTYTQSGTYTWTGKNAAGCDSVVTLNLTITPQPEKPSTACWQTATFNNQSCAWVVTGTQPERPATACWQTATFNNQTCAWVVTGTQPAPTATITPAGATTFCTGGNVVLNANTGTGLTYQWRRNGTNISGATSAAYTATTAGAYTVVVNSSSCSATSTAVSVTVNTAPSAPTASVTVQPNCTIATGTIVVTSPTGTGNTYSINGTVYQASSTFAGISPGTVNVTVRNSSGCTSPATLLTVNTQPAKPATPTATLTQPTCTTATGSITVTAPTGTGLTYSIDGTNFQTGTSFSGLSAGPKTITVKNASGCISTANFTINQQPTIQATITPAGSTTFCSGGSVLLNANTGTGLTYQWRRNGTNINGATSAAYTVTTAGAYTVVVKNSSNCSATSSSVSVTVNQPSAASESVTASNSFTWNGNTYTQSGTYTWTGKNKAGCDSVVTLNLTVITCVAPTNPSISGTNAICAGASTTFTASASGTSANTTYSWTGPNNFFANTAAIANLNTAGTYTCTISNGAGCNAVVSRVLTINALPNANVTASGTLNLCTGGSVTLSTTAFSGQTFTWRNNGTVISGATASSYTASAAGSYTVTVTTSAGCSATSIASVVTVNPIPAIPSTLTGPTMICTLTSGTYTASPVSGALSYTWSLPAGLTGTSTTNSINVAINDANFSSGAVTVRANTAFCSSNAKTLTIAKVPATPSSLSGSPTVTCGITSGSYTSSASTGATQYNWVLPSGFSGTSLNTSIATTINNAVFNSGNISVTASNTCGVSPARTLAVSKVPFTPASISGPTMTCGLTSATYTASTGSNVSSYTWTLPAGMTGSSTTNTINVTINNSVLTSGNITVKANNACGSSPARSLAVSKLPARPSSITGPGQICGLTTATYTCTAITGATSYNWVLPAGLTGSSTTNSITVSVNATLFTGGNVSVQAVNSCGSSAARTLALTKVLAAPTTISGPAYICGLTTATYTATAVTGATSYNWLLPAGLTGTSSTNSITVTVNPASFTSGSVSVAAVNACGAGAARTLALSKIPATPATLNGPSAGVCAGSTQTYSCSATTNASSYTWLVPSGAIINSGQGTTSVSVTFPSTFTSGTVSVTSNSACGSSAARSLSVASKTAQPGTITGTSTNLCAGGTFTFSIAAVTGATSYSWTAPTGCSFSGASTGTSVSLVVPAGFTSGTLSVVANNACGASTARSLTITGAPATPITLSGPTSVCPSSAGHVYTTTPVTGVTNYEWTVPAGAIITAGSGTYSIIVKWGTSAGSVSVKAGNVCGVNSTARSQAVSLASCRNGEEEISSNAPDLQNDIRLFPNPSSNNVNLEIYVGESFNNHIRITDMLGKVLIDESRVLVAGKNTFVYDMSPYAKGLYMVTVSDGTNQQVLKLVKE